VLAIAASLPWLLPGLAVTAAVSVLGSSALGRSLGVRRSIAWVLLFSVGVILSSTLSPLATGGTVAPDSTGCDLSRTWPASLADLSHGEDVAANILMFIPLGFAIAVAPLSRRKVLVIAAGMALPLVIEAIQLRVTVLDRACQGADVVDNLTGLAVGLVAGVALARLAPAIRRPVEPNA
jgi:VanZ like family